MPGPLDCDQIDEIASIVIEKVAVPQQDAVQ